MLINANLDQIQPTDTIVVANNRQVLALKKTWHQVRGNTILPNIFAWQHFLQKTFAKTQAHLRVRLISAIESRELIKRSMAELGQANDAQLLDEVIKNHNYCSAHLIPLNELSSAFEPSAQQFSTWIKHYQQFKASQNLVDSNDLSKLIFQEEIQFQTFYVYGFKTLTPEQNQIFEKFNYQIIKPNQVNQTIETHTFQTITDELYNVANWAKTHHQQHPHKTIAIVCPNLKQDFQLIKSTFDEVFSDTLCETGKKSYNISLGLVLTQYPLILDLLKILSLSIQIQDDDINYQTLNAAITSPFISAASHERSERALLVNKVLALSKQTLHIKTLEPLLINTPDLIRVINQLKQQTTTEKQTLDQWLVQFNLYLQIWGFASDRALNSDEFQLFNKFQQSSLSLNQLASYHATLNSKQALELLKSSLSQVIFQAQSAKTPIQILGTLEAEGLYFNNAWAVGMTDKYLPAGINSPYFIPHQIAQKHHIPFSNFELINTDAKHTLDNLKNLAQSVVFSYAKSHAEQAQQPTPLLQFKLGISLFDHTYEILKQEKFIDNQAKALLNTQVKGGVGILKSQISCAFKGFTHRLKCEDFDTPEVGLRRFEQGNLIHQVLQHIYQVLPTHSHLIDCAKADLNLLVKKTIKQQLKQYKPSAFIQVEYDRLYHIICQFLESEKNRDSFDVVATEQVVESNINGLQFTTRLDRIDNTENGRIIFDYKTGNLPSNPWCSDPIKEVQLPIYAHDNLADAIAFIQLSADKTTYSGFAKDKQILPKKSTWQSSCVEWDVQKHLWEEQLNHASSDFQQGVANVLPTQYACQYCNYSSLCRIQK